MSMDFDTWADQRLTTLVEEMPRLLEPFTQAAIEEAHRIAFDNLSGRVLRPLTGALRDSLRAESTVTPDGPQATLTAGSSRAPYAAIHEFGGLTGFRYLTRIPARPYLRPALEEATRLTAPIVGERLSMALGGA